MKLSARISVVLCAVIVSLAPLRAEADEIRNRQWHLAALGIPEAQRLSQGDGGRNAEVGFDQELLQLLQIIGIQAPDDGVDIGERQALEPGPERLFGIAKTRRH